LPGFRCTGDQYVSLSELQAVFEFLWSRKLTLRERRALQELLARNDKDRSGAQLACAFLR
jgi:hypothetical protein